MINFSDLAACFTDLDKKNKITFSESATPKRFNRPTLTRLTIAHHADDRPSTVQKTHEYYDIIFHYLTQKMQDDTDELSVERITAQWEVVNHFFLKAPSLVWKHDFLMQLCDNPRCIEALQLLVQHFGLTPKDLCMKKRDTSKIRIMQRLASNDLSLPPSLSDYQHAPLVNLTKDMRYKPFFFNNIQRLMALDEQSIQWVQWMIQQEMLSFSLLMEKVLATTHNLPAFFSWLKEWKELAQMTEDMLTDPAWSTKKDQVSPRQQAIRHIVANGFPEDFERLACAKYILQEKRPLFFRGKNAVLNASNINNISLLEYFLAALPLDIAGISLCGHLFNNQTFSVVMELLPRFMSLDIIIFDQLLSKQQQVALAQLVRRVPTIRTIRFARPYAPENEEMIEFLLTLDAIYIEVDIYPHRSRDPKKELGFRFFCHNMACQQQREGGRDIKIDLNAEHVCLSPAGVENLLRFLSTSQAADKVTVISGSIDDWRSVQIQDFFSLLKGLSQLRGLHLEYKEAVLISQRVENLKAEKPDLEFSVVKETKKNTPSIAAPTLQEEETIENAVRYTEQWVVERMDHQPVHVEAYNIDIPQVLGTFEGGLGSCLSIGNMRAQFSPFQYAVPFILRGNQSMFEEAKKYAKAFFDRIIIPVAEERERLVRVLESTVDSPSYHPDAKEAVILSHRIHLLSGFLDEQGQHLISFEETIVSQLQERAVHHQDLMNQKNELIQHLEKDLEVMFSKKTSSRSIKVNTSFLRERLPGFIVPESVSDDAKVAALHESRKLLGNVLKKCIGTVLMIPASIITVCSLGYCNAVHSIYANFFTTQTAKTLYRAKDQISTLSKKSNYPDAAL